jgi:pyridoxal phosphate enzyme (YggS family)
LEGRGDIITLLYDAYIQQVEERITRACERSGRSRADVQVIAVTKYIGVPEAHELVRAGLTHLGENRWQVAKEKWEAIGEQAAWHFIGHLQTNKVKDIVGRFNYIHSLDRTSLLEAVQKRASQLDIIVPAFIQLNVSGEVSKYGLDSDLLFEFAKEAALCPNIRIIGLMAMAPHEEDPEQTRPVFRQLRELRDELNVRQVLPEQVAHLSMGMSNDFEVAIEEGATWLRLGSILLGR